MSTSPEAKQAAIHIVNGTNAETFQLGYIEGFVQQAIDAATAKLREANDNLFKVARKHSVENRELKLVVSNQRKQLYAQLAHQQPDAPTPEYCPCYSYMDGDTDPSCPMHGTHGKSVPTPAPKLAYLQRQEVNKLIEEAQGDLESVLFRLVSERDEARQTADRTSAQARARAALTGTGEK